MQQFERPRQQPSVLSLYSGVAMEDSESPQHFMINAYTDQRSSSHTWCVLTGMC